MIEQIKKRTDTRVAVLTNGSLLWNPAVRSALSGADVVLPSLDAGDERLFRRVNRPHASLGFEQMVRGMETFSREFSGEVWLEIFLLKGITSSVPEVEKIARLARHIDPTRIQLNTASRPPAESFAREVPREHLRRLTRLFHKQAGILAKPDKASRATAHESGLEEILALLHRRPCTAADLAQGLGLHSHQVVKLLESLEACGLLARKRTRGRMFYVSSRKKGTHDLPR
jgi:wyosine [tRNA(Phe)-imidazoG37] synthetase (radical SAM superfamily)